MRLALPLIALAALALAAGEPAAAPEAPTVVTMSPANGAADVDPALGEIRVTFSEPMRDRSWSVTGGGPGLPELLSIGYEPGCTLLVLKVRLRPGTTYRFGLNSSSHRNFVSGRGVALEPVLVTFTTRGEPTPAPDAPAPYAPAPAAPAPPAPTRPPIAFDLEDVNGVRVTSQDYAGVPLFLLFGAAW